MDFTSIGKILNDLPPTFKRPGIPYTQLIDSLTAAMTRYANGADGTTSQISFLNAQYGWLDFWGLLFGIPRNAEEPDQRYLARIVYTVNTGGGSPEAIRLWLLNVWGITATVVEKFPQVGYQITLPAVLTMEQALIVLQSLIYVRPAGIPFYANFSNDGLYLETVNFLGAPRVTGSYLTGGTTIVVSDLKNTTNNASPLLPDLYLTDALLNPGLST